MGASRPILQRRGGLAVVLLPPSWLRVVVPDRPMTGADILAAVPHASAILDGAMFRVCPGQPEDYARYQCGLVNYALLDAVTGALARTTCATCGGTLLVDAKGRATVVDGADPATWGTPWFAWQGYPTMIRRGVVVARPDRDATRTKRGGCGLHRSGAIAFISGFGSMYEVACRALDLDIEELFYGDGGGSLVLAVRHANGRIEADTPANLTGRRVPSFLCAIDPATWSLGQ